MPIYGEQVEVRLTCLADISVYRPSSFLVVDLGDDK